MLKYFGLPAGQIQFGGMTMAHFSIPGELNLLICEIGRKHLSHGIVVGIRYVSSAGHMLDAHYVIANVDLPKLVGSLINCE